MTPEGWACTAISNLLQSVTTGVSVNSQNRPRCPGELGVLKTSAVTYGAFRPNENKVVLQEDIGRAREHPEAGCVLFSRMNTLELVGASAYVPNSYPDLVLPDRIWQLRPALDRVDGKWLHQMLSSPSMRARLSEVASGTSGSMKNISQEKLLNLPVPCPPLVEQRKIAAILSSVDDAIEATQAVIDQLQVVKKAMLAELLTRGLPRRHTRFKQTETGRMPDDWRNVRIVDVADVDYGVSDAVAKNKDAQLGWPIITGANISLDGELDMSKKAYYPPQTKANFILRKGDLLLNWRSGSAAHVGKTALFELDEPHTYASFVLRVRSRGELLPEFGWLLLNHMRENEYFSRDLAIQVNFKMNAAVFREVRIVCPSLDEQEKIAEIVLETVRRLRAEEAYKESLGALKAALSSALLTGEIRVQPDEATP